MSHTIDEWNNFYDYIIGRIIEKIVSSVIGYSTHNPLPKFLKSKGVNLTYEQCINICKDLVTILIVNKSPIRKYKEFRRYTLYAFINKVSTVTKSVALHYMTIVKSNDIGDKLLRETSKYINPTTIMYMIKDTWDEFIDKDFAFKQPDINICTASDGNHACGCIPCGMKRVDNPLLPL